MGILILIGGFLAINIRKAFQEQKFKSETAAIAELINKAQNILLIANVDTSISFKKENNLLKVDWAPIGNSNFVFDKLIERSLKSLTAVEKLEYNNSVETLLDSFQLNYKDLGFHISSGLLSFTAKDGKMAYIYLPPYPAHVKVQERSVDVANESREENTFYESLTQSTWQNPHVQNN